MEVLQLYGVCELSCLKRTSNAVVYTCNIHVVKCQYNLYQDIYYNINYIINILAIYTECGLS